MTITYIKKSIATLEFEASRSATNFSGIYLSICAYGDFWDEWFSNYKNMAKYLKEEFNLTDKEIEKIKENEYYDE